MRASRPSSPVRRGPGCRRASSSSSTARPAASERRSSRTCSEPGAKAVAELGARPIDYRASTSWSVRRLTGDGVDAAIDGIGGTHTWRSRRAFRRGGKVVVYGLTSSLRAGRLASGRRHRHRYRGIPIFALYIAGGWVLPGPQARVPYSIQWLERRRPSCFREDLTAPFDLLRQEKIRPRIARKFPLRAVREAHELLGGGGVIGKIVLVLDGAPCL